MASSEARVLDPDSAPAEARPRVLHSVLYGSALQAAVLDAREVPGRQILERAAAEVVFRHLTQSPGWSTRSVEARLGAVVELFRDSGLGLLDVAKLAGSGGVVTLTAAPGARGRGAEPPVTAGCVLSAGLLTGALAAALDVGVGVQETSCAPPRCRFSVQPTGTAVDLLDDDHYPVPPAAPAPYVRALPVDEEKVLSVVLGAGLGAADARGRIEMLGVPFLRLWGEFYAKVSYRFEREVPRRMGSKFANLPSLVLTEAGHRAAFHTLGEVLRSDAWCEGVAPQLQDPAEWAHALVAVVNGFGWGTWRIQSLVAGERLLLRVYESYEALEYRKHFGRATDSKCYLARGTAAAIMNLLFVGDPASRLELTPSYYNRLFRSPLSFRALETRCRAGDSPFCEFVVNPLSPLLSARFLEKG